MGQILKLPAQASKLGYRRARKCAKAAESPDQLHLFPGPRAQILSFSAGLGPFEQALALDENGDARAAEFYATAIAEQDCAADAYCNLGIIESQKGNSIKAFDCFTTCLKQNPRHSEAHYNLGNLYFELNDFRLAQLHFEMAAEVEPSFANAYFNLALVQAINHDLAASANALAKYQALVSEEEARVAGELVEDLKKSFGNAAKDTKIRTS